MSFRTRARVLALTATIAVVAPATAATAAVSRGDTAATRAFISAGTRFYEGSLADVPGLKRQVTGFVDRVASGCPGALSGFETNSSPTVNDNESKLAQEAMFDLDLVALKSMSAPQRQVSAAVARLHWIAQPLDRAVAVYVTEHRDLLALSPSDLCADIKASAATSFTTLAPGTTRLLDEAARIPFAFELPDLLTRMTADIPASSRPQAARLRRLAQRLDAAVNPVLSAQFERLGQVLGATG